MPKTRLEWLAAGGAVPLGYLDGREEVTKCGGLFVHGFPTVAGFGVAGLSSFFGVVGGLLVVLVTNVIGFDGRSFDDDCEFGLALIDKLQGLENGDGLDQFPSLPAHLA